MFSGLICEKRGTKKEVKIFDLEDRFDLICEKKRVPKDPLKRLIIQFIQFARSQIFLNAFAFFSLNLDGTA